ncbi:SRPBCC family protein [Streptomyces sp. H10-C2]|uniref:SRPBCC family protein n=1 Tax=unclassified Streptomyces TaxID=2593676 RepID=UPI0024BB8882|nr:MULTISPECIES: SRPBCC family protein [unclassified Streptomyces]MDJ0343535.1 SRPBCC family protein [Streptomyces sp. PH10-H1]MDJ0368889.1 SRPBCC family protein [Streptomyces sp. H10-C2]
MALFSIERYSPLPVDEVWRRLTRWERHAAHVPLTRISVTTPPPTRVGTVFVARTGLGPVGFDDPMEIVRWDPPSPGVVGHCRLEKRGTVVVGWAEIEVSARDTGSWLVWREDLRVRRLPRLFDGTTVLSGRLLFGRAITGLLAER